MKSVRVDMEKPSAIKKVALDTLGIIWSIVAFIPSLVWWVIKALAKAHIWR